MSNKQICFLSGAICFVVFLFMLVPFTFAHGGKTDSNGGHYDHDTGEYHYHHGYPAHEHENGICPYDYDDKTNSNDYISSSSYGSSSNYVSSYKQEKTDKLLSFLIPALIACILYIFFAAILDFWFRDFFSSSSHLKLDDCDEEIRKHYQGTPLSNQGILCRSRLLGGLIGFFPFIFLVAFGDEHLVIVLILSIVLSVIFTFWTIFEESDVRLYSNDSYLSKTNLSKSNFLKTIAPVRFSHWITAIYAWIITIMLFIVYFHLSKYR